MLFNWFTFAVQLVNFLILLWLLKRFLYGPIRKVMQQRREREAEEMEKAKRLQQEAEDRRDGLEKKRRELDERKEDILEKARQEARDERKRLISEAEEEVRAKRTAWLNALDDQQEDFFRRLREGIVNALSKEMSLALDTLAHSGMTAVMVRTFIERLANVEQSEEMQRFFDSADGSIAIVVAQSIDESEMDELQKAISNAAGGKVEVTVEEDAGLGAGIELKTVSEVLGWNLRDYADDAVRSVEEMMDRKKRQLEDAGA